MRLLSAPWVVPIATPPIAEGAVAVDDDGTVIKVGRRADLRAEFTREERGEGVLLPALVNAHTHLELSALSGRVPGGAGLVPWAMEVAREAAAMPVEQKEAAALRAAQSMVEAGTTAVGDVGNSLLAVEAIDTAGLGGVMFHELLGSRDVRTGDALADAAAERADFALWPERLGYVPAPHAPYSAGPELLRRIFAISSPHPTSMHVAEDADEIALLADGSGRWAPILEAMGIPPGSRTPRMRPIAYLASLGAFAGPRRPLLVHMVHADSEDRALAQQFGAPVVVCARSNLHLGGRLPDLPALFDLGVKVALGTDSLASSPDLSLWGEIATLAAQFPDVPATTWLTAATWGGATALGLPALGALAPGKRPGIIEVAADDLLALIRDPAPRVRWMASA